MNYQLHYNRLMQRAQGRLLETYTEKHHIVPRCLGGTDESTNLVVLTPEEHYVAHQLLVKMYPTDPGLVYAAQMMTVSNAAHNRSNKMYGWLRRRHHKICKARVGKKNPSWNRPWYSNPDTNENIKLSADANPPPGFYRGRYLTWKYCIQCSTKHSSSISRLSLCVECYSDKTIRKIHAPARKPRQKIHAPARKPRQKQTPRIYTLNCKNCGSSFEHVSKHRKCCTKECGWKISNGARTQKIKREVIADGIRFASLTDAAAHYGITVEAIRYRIKSGRYKS